MIQAIVIAVLTGLAVKMATRQKMVKRPPRACYGCGIMTDQPFGVCADCRSKRGATS